MRSYVVSILFSLGCLVGLACGEAEDPTPRFVSVVADRSVVNQGEDAVITAIVELPEEETVVAAAGVFRDGNSVGTFTSTEPNIYQATLLWDDLVGQSTSSLAGENATENFTVRFVDGLGREFSREIAFELGCGNEQLGICKGACDPLVSSNHCGACGRQCKEGEFSQAAQTYSGPSTTCQQAVMIAWVVRSSR